jgi:MFS superfamily sulfate permease-like transporter
MSSGVRSPISKLKADVPAGLVVFLVAVPLCLGIAQASSAPLLSGLVAGIVGGIVVALASGSPLSVSGPAAGLAVVVAAGIRELGLRPFLLSVVIAGGLQLGMGALRLGAIAHYFPSAVIKGMLAAIGVLIVLKQVPHAVGYDKHPEVQLSLRQTDGSNTFSALGDAAGSFSLGAVAISLLCVAIMLGWPKVQRNAVTKLIPPALVAVVAGALAAAVLAARWPMSIAAEGLVSLPRFRSLGDIRAAVVVPDFSRVFDPAVWRVGATIGIVASLETLLSLEAVDRLDPHKRISPPNRELLAQGAGNVVSGLLGGLPLTSVIVRSSANVQAGAQSRAAAVVHGVLLLVGLLFFAPLLNRVPLAALAVVLIFVGLKLTTPALWRQMWSAGPTQFVPFAVTIGAIVSTDLLKGTVIGLVVGVAVMIRNQQRNAIVVAEVDGKHVVRFMKDMTFLQKGRIKEVLGHAPVDRPLVIDRRVVDYVDDDVEELLDEHCAALEAAGVSVEILFEAGAAERYAARRARRALASS